MERSKQRAYDYALVIVLGIIIVTGLVILYSTSAYNGKLKFQDSFYYLKKQIFATLLGIAGMWIIARVDYHVWKKWSVPGDLVSVLLGIAVLLIGDEYNGSKRWLSLGPFSFQPSEFAKVAVILFLTYVIMRNVKSMGKFTTVCKIVVSVLPVVGLVGASMPLVSLNEPMMKHTAILVFITYYCMVATIAFWFQPRADRSSQTK